ncbi:MAG: hypothetical protein QOG41_976 [Thermoleophilaceae bacterium]|nr:hypothetical protein [Thermoleophilaceae bacterium]MEA2388203.1 hypothetical protein [Thermoleophilaceae bacterium]
MPPYTLVHRDDCERNADWSLVRRSLDLHAFGINLVDIPPGGSIPRHDEVDRDQEEVFFVISGNPTVVVDDEELPAPAGTFIRVDAEPKRTVKNDGLERASVLIMSAPRSSGYKPMAWA